MICPVVQPCSDATWTLDAACVNGLVPDVTLNWFPWPCLEFMWEEAVAVQQLCVRRLSVCLPQTCHNELHNIYCNTTVVIIYLFVLLCIFFSE